MGKLNGNLAILAGTFPPTFGPNVITFQKSKLGKLHAKVKMIQSALKLPKQANTQLKNINKSLNALEKVLEALSLVKQIKKVAKKMETQIEDLRAQITKAQKKLDEVEDQLKPYLEAVNLYEKELMKLVQDIYGFQMGLKKYTSTLEQAEKCISTFPEGDAKSEMEEQFSIVVTESESAVVVLNQILEMLMTASDDLVLYLDETIMDAVNDINKIDDAIDKFEDDLEDLLDPLEELNDFMKSSVTLKFKYPASKVG